MARVQAPVIPLVGDLIRRTPGTISLGQGIVSYPPPPGALAALRDFGRNPDDHRYGPVEGERPLLDAIARKLVGENRLSLSDRRLIVTAGGNMGFLNAVLAITDPGDELILPVPFYFNHDMAIAMAGCRTVAVRTASDYQLAIDEIAHAITTRTRAVVTVSPNNPSGAVYSADSLRAVNDVCRERGIYHITDEAYEYFTYDGARHVSPAAWEGTAEHTISLYSLSKAYGMAGWRVGYMVIPDALFEAVNKIQDTNLICPPRASQHVALAALGEGASYCRPFVESLGQVRRRALEAFGHLGGLVRVPPVQGAFYLLLEVQTGMDPFALVERLVREHRVAAIPGSAFGLTGGCYLRVSYGALAPDTVVEGIARLCDGLIALAR
jgi:aspartate/methionine/tyrosine aminotransferase